VELSPIEWITIKQALLLLLFVHRRARITPLNNIHRLFWAYWGPSIFLLPVDAENTLFNRDFPSIYSNRFLR